MAEATIAHPERTDREGRSGERSTREQRGWTLYRERGGEIESLGRGWYRVPGCSGGVYSVYLAVLGGEEFCDCPDFWHREQTCKHIFAATIHRAKRGEEFRREAQRRHAEREERASLGLAGLERMGVS